MPRLVYPFHLAQTGGPKFRNCPACGRIQKELRCRLRKIRDSTCRLPHFNNWICLGATGEKRHGTLATDTLVGCLVWLAGWMVGGLVGWLVGWLLGCWLVSASLTAIFRTDLKPQVLALPRMCPRRNPNRAHAPGQRQPGPRCILQNAKFADQRATTKNIV